MRSIAYISRASWNKNHPGQTQQLTLSVMHSRAISVITVTFGTLMDRFNNPTFDKIVGQIYDCAANPELWEGTLETIRLTVNAAYIVAVFADTSAVEKLGTPFQRYWHTSWDKTWLADVERRIMQIPGGDALLASDIDNTWTQMNQVSETEFQQSQFYNEWAKPQGLRDCAITPFIKRNGLHGVLSSAGYQDRPLFSTEDCVFFERLSVISWTKVSLALLCIRAYLIPFLSLSFSSAPGDRLFMPMPQQKPC
jgi:hypothetical protein